jgi:hypothetical protein
LICRVAMAIAVKAAMAPVIQSAAASGRCVMGRPLPGGPGMSSA